VRWQASRVLMRERATTRDANAERMLLVAREHMAALDTLQIAADPILLRNKVAAAMWACLEEQHLSTPFVLPHGVLQPTCASLIAPVAKPLDLSLW
jgi:hypothetical protein